jgi:uncharacterized membrane protein HdeD (DUF308 family)
MLASILSRYWWLTLLRGILWILFGIAVIAQPGITLLSLTLALGLIFFADGVLNVVAAIRGRREEENWWVLLLAGAAGIFVGLLTFMNPGLSELALIFYVAIWSVATGLLEIVAAIRLRKEVRGEFWLILAGIVSVAFGVLVMAQPEAGALALLWLIAVYAMAFGVILFVLAFRERGFMKRVTPAI